VARTQNTWWGAALLVALAGGCSSSPRDIAPVASGAAVPVVVAAPSDRSMTVHFYDVGQGLAALVDLPDGRHLLVDTGDRPHRPGCGEVCDEADRRLLTRLHRDLAGAPIDVLWITHGHSDHVGGAPEVLAAFPVGTFVDNGRDGRRAEIRRARSAAEQRHATIVVVDPEHRAFGALDSPGVTVTPVVPPAWPARCAHDANECSIALRVDFGATSVLFTGDAEHEEEMQLDPLAPVTLLQVGHHGSETSTSPAFLSKVHPRYAVISAGRPGQGLNRAYCHPRAIIVERLTRVLGGPATGSLQAFDGDRCNRARPDDWTMVPSSDALWATERDGDVVLTTRGDGVFTRVLDASAPAARSGP
jgi:competence protein ComEC